MLDSLDINTVIGGVINGGLGLAALKLVSKLGVVVDKLQATVDLLVRRVDQHDEDFKNLNNRIVLK